MGSDSIGPKMINGGQTHSPIESDPIETPVLPALPYSGAIPTAGVIGGAAPPRPYSSW